MNRNVVKAILLGGIIAATMDIAAACLITGRNPEAIVHFIAGGLLGKAASAGGTQTAILGLALQEAMGMLIAAIYVLLLRWVPILRRSWYASGLAYGVVIFFVMNYVVMPLSAWNHAPTFTPIKFAEHMIAMLLFGLIVAFFSRGEARRPFPLPQQA